MGKRIVVWSGGADSTYTLSFYSSFSSEDDPVLALSIDSHEQVDSGLLREQRRVRKKFLKFAEKKGWHIDNQFVYVGYSDGVKVKVGENSLSQPMMWLCAILPFVDDGDKVYFSYIHGDCFWHQKQEFIDAFNAICKMKRISADLVFPVEDFRKYQILQRLAENGIGKDLWWSCESPKNHKPCGFCYKCCELMMADISWMMEQKNPHSPFYKKG